MRPTSNRNPTPTPDNYANIGGILRATNGGALEINYGGGTYSGSFYDQNGSANHNTAMANHILIDGGVLSFKGVANVQLGESTTVAAAGVASLYHLTWAGNNALRLNNAQSTDTGSYTLANHIDPKNFTRLELVNGTTAVARALTIDGDNGGSILFNGTTATIPNGVTLTGAAATLTAEGATPSTLTGELSGGSLVKTGPGTLTLATAPSYTGNTTIEDGTLGLSHPNFNAASTLTIGVTLGSPAVLDLPSGTYPVAVLVIDGETMGDGLYDSGNSGGAIAGEGKILVGAAVPSFALWASGFTSPPLTNTAADADPDHDGLQNAVEYVLGSDPRFANPGGPTAAITGTDLVVTFNRKDSAETGDVAMAVAVSTDLTDWTSLPGYIIGATNAAPTSPGVDINEAGPNDSDIITVTIPMALNPRKFARLSVTITP